MAAEAGYRSPTVTNITNNRGVSIGAINKYLAQQEMEISNGYGVFKDKAFRIAHMGEATAAGYVPALCGDGRLSGDRGLIRCGEHNAQ